MKVDKSANGLQFNLNFPLNFRDFRRNLNRRIGKSLQETSKMASKTAPLESYLTRSEKNCYKNVLQELTRNFDDCF